MAERVIEIPLLLAGEWKSSMDYGGRVGKCMEPKGDFYPRIEYSTNPVSGLPNYFVPTFLLAPSGYFASSLGTFSAYQVLALPLSNNYLYLPHT